MCQCMMYILHNTVVVVVVVVTRQGWISDSQKGISDMTMSEIVRN